MAKPVVMPQRGLSEESSLISKFYKNKGEAVKAGEAIFSIETDKTSFEVESEEDGIVLEVFYKEGDEVPVLSTVCVIGQAGEDIGEYVPKTETTSVEDKKEESVDVKDNTKSEADIPVSTAAPVEGDRIKISPRAKQLAEKSGVVYTFASPSGPEGRIIERDIVSLINNGPSATMAAKGDMLRGIQGQLTSGSGIGGRVTTGDLSAAAANLSLAGAMPVSMEQTPLYEEVKLSSMRKAIAKNMHQSLSSTAQLTIHASFDATDVLAYRKKIKENKERLGLDDVSINDIILYAVSRTLPNHKDLNSHFLDDRMLVFNNVHLGIAVDIEKGLVVPTIFNTNLKSLNEIAKDAKAVISQCKNGNISPEILKGASFTITNLGTFDIEFFTPVLNPPQVGILGVNTIVYSVKEVDGELVNYPSIGLSLTFDHRAVDGAPAAKFLKELKTNLENFSILLAK